MASSPLKCNDLVLLFDEEKEPVVEAFVCQTHESKGLQPGRVGIIINAVFTKTPMTVLNTREVEVEISFPLICPLP